MKHGIQSRAKGLSIRTSNQQKHIIYKLWNLNPYSSHVQTPTHYNAQQNTLRPYALKIPLRLYIVCAEWCDAMMMEPLRYCCSLPFSLHAFNFTLPACIAWLYAKSLLYLYSIETRALLCSTSIYNRLAVVYTFIICEYFPVNALAFMFANAVRHSVVGCHTALTPNFMPTGTWISTAALLMMVLLAGCMLSDGAVAFVAGVANNHPSLSPRTSATLMLVAAVLYAVLWTLYCLSLIPSTAIEARVMANIYLYL